jgi:glycosyltransferase involved in cell wall biosynthesis
LARLRIVAYTDSAEVGGAEHALAHLLAALDDATDASVVAVSPVVASFVGGGRPSTLVARPRSTAPDARALREHVRVLRAARPDVVHANLISPFSCQYGLAAAIVLRRPSIAVYQLPNAPANSRQRLLKRLTTARTSAHVGVGERTSREIESILGLPAGRVRTIHNGVPDAPVPASVESGPRPTIGAVGRLAPQKGFDVLIAALADVPAAQLVLVGGGEEEARLRALAERRGVASRVRFAGPVDDPRAMLGSFDVFAMPSRFEGFPLAVLEAQLAELPVVAAAVGSVPEAVIHEQTGLLVPPDDPAALARALNRLLADGDGARRLGGAARRLVLERFTADHMARRFEELYASLAASR